MTGLPKRATILTYHSLDVSGSVISVSPADFRAHMESLSSRGVRGIALCDLVEAWETGRELTEPSVVLTFDDAFLNVAEHGAPILTRLGFRATIFAVSSHCGGTNNWSGDPAPEIPRLPLLSLPQLRELAKAGFEIGSHGRSHAALDRLSPLEAEAEIVDSRRALEDGLSGAVGSFAYPYGRAIERTRALVRKHYRAACSTEFGETRAAEDRHFLSRIDAYYLRSPFWFSKLWTKPGRAYVSLRGFGRRVRGRLFGETPQA